MRYTTFLLDLDHTLFDSDTSEDAAFAQTLLAAGIDEPDRYREGQRKPQSGRRYVLLIDKLMKNPTRAFATPKEVCETITLSRDQKVRVLRRWQEHAATADDSAKADWPTDATVTVEEISASLRQLMAPRER